MLKVGITGGIGSGKSTVCQVFQTLGIPVFKADDAARYLMEHDATLIRSIKQLFGDDAYENEKLVRGRVSSLVFNNDALLAKLNALIHPATIAYSREWMGQQNTPYVLKEAAIFFESGSNKEMDVMIGVWAPVEVRIDRTIKRGNTTEEKVRSIIAHQMDEQEKMNLCDFVINNDGSEAIIPQVLALHQKLLTRATI
jgi:dephospho-CoA kinase